MFKFIYKGYFCKESSEFFGDKVIVEERDGCAVVGRFIILKDGRTYLPSKGDEFLKTPDGDIIKI
jgi:hypothetical protein